MNSQTLAFPLLAGAAAVDITPQETVTLAGLPARRDCEGVLDALHARAVVLDNGQARLALVLLDLIYLMDADYAWLRARIAQALEIPVAHVTVCCTHTHTAPSTRPRPNAPREDAYMDWAMPRIVQAAQQALAALEPAEAAWGIGHEARPQYNRRYHMRDGSVRTNPGLPEEIVRPAGPTDPQLPLLLLRRAGDGSPLAVVANYSLHYVGDFSELMVSSDYFGEFSAIAARRLGESCVALLTHGASGDINNVNHQKLPTPWYPEKMERKERSRLIAGWLVDQVQQVWESAAWHSEVPLGAVELAYDLPVRPMSEEEVARAERIVADENLSRRQRLNAQNWLATRELAPTWPLPVVCLRVGDWGAATLPGELFCQYGLDLKFASPFAVTAPIEMANAHVGYVPTRYSFELGAYETWHSAHLFENLNSGHELVTLGARGLRQLWVGQDEEKLSVARRESAV